MELFLFLKKKNFLKYNNRLGNKNYFYDLQFPESLELDNMNDVKLMRSLIK